MHSLDQSIFVAAAPEDYFLSTVSQGTIGRINKRILNKGILPILPTVCYCAAIRV